MQLQLTGQITGIEARNGGWFAVAFQEQGQNYPKKLSTKKPELVAQCQQMMGQWATALYNESESTNINPNNGQPYMNRYLEALAMAGQGLPPAQQQSHQPQQPGPQAYGHQPQQQGYQPQPMQPQVQPGFQPQPQQPQVRVSDDLREARIMRQSAAKVSVELLAHLDPPDRNLASLVRISEQLVGYFRDGVQWTTPPVQQQPVGDIGQTGIQGGGSEYNPGYAAQPGAVPAQPQQQAAPQGGVDSYDDIPFTGAIW